MAALFVVGLAVLWAGLASAADWCVGIARTDITPKKPVWMAGYAARDHLPDGKIHPLWAKAMVIEDSGGRRVVLLTTDLIGFGRTVSDAIKAAVQKQAGIEPERVVLNASHTHSGPVVFGCAEVAYGLSEKDRAAAIAYRDELIEKLGKLVADASKKMQPANLAYGQGKATFAMNRRKRINPDGPVDHTVPVLRVTGDDGRLLAVLFGYACHNTTLAIYQYNGDYAGFAQVDLEKAHPEATALFMIGCGADVNPDPRRTVELAQKHGKSLATAVDQVLAAGKMHPVRGKLAMAFGQVDLPFVDPPTKDELEKRRGQGNKYQQRLTNLLLDRLAKQGSLANSHPCPVQVVRFGDDLTLVALPGETVVDYALRLRKEFPGKPLWVAGYCNDIFAYLPSERVLAEGGYEGGTAMVYFGWHGPFKPGVEDRVIGLVKKLVSECSGQ